MLVKELIDKLSKLDQSLIVCCASPIHDYPVINVYQTNQSMIINNQIVINQDHILLAD